MDNVSQPWVALTPTEQEMMDVSAHSHSPNSDTSTIRLSPKTMLFSLLLLAAATAQASVLTLNAPRVTTYNANAEGIRTEVYVYSYIRCCLIVTSLAVSN